MRRDLTLPDCVMTSAFVEARGRRRERGVLPQTTKTPAFNWWVAVCDSVDDDWRNPPTLVTVAQADILMQR